MTTTKDVFIRMSSTYRQAAVCKGCKKAIVWMETLNGKKMPMNSYAMPRQEGEGGVSIYAAEDSHWATCSQRKQFDRR